MAMIWKCGKMLMLSLAMGAVLLKLKACACSILPNFDLTKKENLTLGGDNDEPLSYRLL